MDNQKVIRALKAAWEREVEAAQLYRLLSEQQEDERRRNIFMKLARVGGGPCPRIWQTAFVPLAASRPANTQPTTATQRLMVRSLGTDAMLRRIEAEEDRNIAQFNRFAQALPKTRFRMNCFARIEEEEKQHASLLHSLKMPDEPKGRLEAILKGEKWHGSTRQLDWRCYLWPERWIGRGVWRGQRHGGRDGHASECASCRQRGCRRPAAKRQSGADGRADRDAGLRPFDGRKRVYGEQIRAGSV